MNEISESVSMETGVLDNAEFLARATPNAINPSAKPISRIVLSMAHPALPSNNSRLSVLIVRLSFAAIIVAPCSKPEALPD